MFDQEPRFTPITHQPDQPTQTFFTQRAEQVTRLARWQDQDTWQLLSPVPPCISVGGSDTKCLAGVQCMHCSVSATLLPEEQPRR